jgi:hypothetical protein
MQGTSLAILRHPQARRRDIMGKYFIAWLLGVPAVVLVVAYLFFH